MKTLKAILSGIQWLSLALVLSTCSEPEQPRPEITTINPDEGTVGAEVIIAGKNFSSTELVLFGNAETTPASRSDTEIRTAVPAGLSPGTLSVTVKTEGGTSNAVSFTVLPSQPEITSIEPDKGSIGMEVTLKGNHFATASLVTFGTKSVTGFISKADTELKLLVPEGLDPGALNVTITTEGGVSGNKTFTVVGKPTISSFTPTTGPAGRKVSIEGTHLEDAGKVFFGTSEAVFDVKSSTSIEVTVPVTATTGKIKVTTPGGEAISGNDFVVKDAPEITDFSPASGIVGTLITINGKGFDADGLVVKVGTGNATTITVVSAAQLTVKVPPAATTGKITIETTAGSAVSDENFTLIGPPVITSFSPTRGGIGTEVVITGEDFLNINDVKFNSTTVSATNYVFVSSTQIKAYVPAGATSGKISITTPAGTGGSVTNFTVLPLPTITSFSPTIGPAGKIVTITGTHFEETSKVFFGTSEAVFQIKSTTSIEATVPLNATTGKVKVITPGGEAVSAVDYIVKGAPEITDFSPTGGIVGTLVTINGKNFDAGVVDVKFGTGKATDITVVSATQITVRVPAVATTGKITVETAAGSVLSANNFTLIGAPAINSFSPTSGTTGVEVDITGSNFVDVNDIKFNNTIVLAANYTLVSPTQIKAKVPAGAISGKISVTTPAGTGTSVNTFIVFPPPTLTSFTPTIGPVGGIVSITGTNFDGASKIFFGATEAVFEVKSSTSIEATVPVGAITGKLKVITPGGEAMSFSDFVVKEAPVISNFSPASGIVGAVITITGENFDAGTVTVKFGTGTATNVTVVSATQITANVPATATTGKITVETAVGSVLSATNFTVIGVPTVTNFAPASGGVGLEVTFTGTNFINVSAVKYNTTTVLAGDYTVVSPTQLKAKVPSGATTGKITVTTPAGTGTSATDFIVLFPPVITSFTPANGAPGINVTINGSGFVDVSSVKFNEIESGAGNFTVNSPAQITAKVPASATSGKIKVTNALSTATSSNTFYVTPFISSVTPPSTSAGSPITISGTNLEGATVNFGSTPATPLTNTGTTITANVPASILGAVNITVVNNGGTSNIKTFTATAPVVLDEIVATKNIAGQLLLLKGTNMLGATKVLFGNVEANILTNTSKVVTTLVPATAVGTYTVKLVTSNGTSNGKAFELSDSQNTNTGGATLVNAGGTSVVTLPPGYVPPVANLWTNTAASGDEGEKFLILEPSDGVFTVRYSIDGFDVAEGEGTYDHNVVDGVMNNYVEFTVNGIRYVGFWTPRTTGVDEFGDSVCFANMTLISTQSGKQLKIIVSDFSNCP